MAIKNLRQLLEFSLETRDVKAAKALIMSDSRIVEFSDLHLSLLLLLAFPEKEQRGRKKDPKTGHLTMHMNLACVVKSNLIGKSFSKTWDEYADNKTRPTIIKNELWQCKGILLQFLEMKDREARIAIQKFDLTEGDLKSL